LTADGQTAFELINGRANEQVAEMLAELSEDDQKRLLKAMFAIQEVLEDRPASSRTYLLRQHEPGDLGWILNRHGALYSAEYGWNEEFETLVAGICQDFLAGHDPKRERCWVAEMNGEVVGSVMIAKSRQKNVAQLRVLLVEPSARGTGLGNRLVDECIRFSRRTGYRKIRLSTYSILESARHLYEKAGFKLVNEEERHDFGHDLCEQTWELEL
jgi:ribosomal protein S18 acetylase RimI-like enzyme